MNINVRINKSFDGYVKGQVVTVSVDVNGMPVTQQWRRRFKDAEVDKCCTVVKKPSQRRTQNAED